VASIVKSKTADADANDLLERDAARVLVTMAPNVESRLRRSPSA